MDIFGSTNPRKMPGHLFGGAIYKNYETAIRSNPEKQNYSVCPRYWYFDAEYICESCKTHFTWSAKEQKMWFEQYYFWVDSEPKNCKRCSASRRKLKELRKEYDAIVASARDGGSYDQKKRVVDIIGQFEDMFSTIPSKIRDTKKLFERQINKM